MEKRIALDQPEEETVERRLDRKLEGRAFPPTFSRTMAGVSRFILRGDNPRHRIVLGWDRPLHTYFAQVWEVGEEELLVLWVGVTFGEITSVDDLAEIVKPYAALPEELCLELVGDKERPAIEIVRRIFQALGKTGGKED